MNQVGFLQSDVEDTNLVKLVTKWVQPVVIGALRIAQIKASTPPIIRIVNLNRGENGAVPNKILDKKIFVIAGEWKEVCSDNAVATEAVKNAITRFGGTVKVIMSKRTGKCFVLFALTFYPRTHLSQYTTCINRLLSCRTWCK